MGFFSGSFVRRSSSREVMAKSYSFLLPGANVFFSVTYVSFFKPCRKILTDRARLRTLKGRFSPLDYPPPPMNGLFSKLKKILPPIFTSLKRISLLFNNLNPALTEKNDLEPIRRNPTFLLKVWFFTPFKRREVVTLLEDPSHSFFSADFCSFSPIVIILILPTSLKSTPSPSPP